MRQNPSLRDSMCLVRKNANKTKLKNNSTGISKQRIDVSVIAKGLIKATHPRTKNILNILLPTTFPTLMLGTFLNKAVNEAASSGSEVPIANTVIPIIQELIPSNLAISTPELTIKLAPITIPRRAMKKTMKVTALDSTFLKIPLKWNPSNSLETLLSLFDFLYEKTQKTKKQIMSINPSIRLKKRSLSKKYKRKTLNKTIGISLFKTLLSTFSGMTTAQTPKTKPMFAILLPIILPRAMVFSPRRAAIIHTASSGAEVPKATRITPTKSGVNLKRSANFTEDWIRKSENQIRIKRPTIKILLCKRKSII